MSARICLVFSFAKESRIMNHELRKIGDSSLNPKRHTLNHNLGFVLLFSLLISSILLATGLGISRLMVRQITLASLSRESQIAFFAADSGLECALHWDVFGKFNTADTPTDQKIYCNGAIIQSGQQTIPPGIQNPNNSACNPFEPPDKNIINGGDKSCFAFSLSNNQACVFVMVDKTDPTGATTKITSNGYNRCSLAAPNILQRTLEITLLNKLTE